VLLYVQSEPQLGCVIVVTPWLLFSRERAPLPIVEEARWASGPELRGVGFESRTAQPVARRFIDHIIPVLIS
jgi:hypothetical protein